ncbi:MAG: imelysin family protein [Bacteroidota bacterium]
MNNLLRFGLLVLVLFATIIVSCNKDNDVEPEPPMVEVPDPDTTTNVVDTMTNTGTVTDTMTMDTTVTSVTEDVNIENLLANQVNELVIPTYETYQEKMGGLLSATETFVGALNNDNLTAVKTAYSEAYLAYQAAGVHNYYATANLDLVNTTNLYPINVEILEELIANESYIFNTISHQRANGFPALDYFLYGLEDPVATFTNDAKAATFLLELVKSMDAKANALVDRWTGNLRANFIGNGGVALGSSVSVQLNETLIYYEQNIRGNKVGIPIGRLGPNDTPFDADGTKIESYYRSLQEGNDSYSLLLLRASIQEMEEIYLGTTSAGEDGIGYEDLLISIEQASIDADIKAQYQAIYDAIDNRGSIVGDDTLYLAIQELVTLYKSDLFPALNVQDADGANDGD